MLNPQIMISVLSVLGESEFNGLNVTVLYGATDPLDLGKLTESNHIDFVQDSPKIASEMVSADLAVSSGGGILWELSFLGIPTLCVVTADNQLPNVASLIERKAIAGLKPNFYFETSSFRETLSYLLSDGDARNTLSRRFDSITDGRGAYRVANLFD